MQWLSNPKKFFVISCSNKIFYENQLKKTKEDLPWWGRKEGPPAPPTLAFLKGLPGWCEQPIEMALTVPALALRALAPGASLAEGWMGETGGSPVEEWAAFLGREIQN